MHTHNIYIKKKKQQQQQQQQQKQWLPLRELGLIVLVYTFIYVNIIQDQLLLLSKETNLFVWPHDKKLTKANVEAVSSSCQHFATRKKRTNENS